MYRGLPSCIETLETGVSGPAVRTTCCSLWNVEHTISVRVFWDTRTGADEECEDGRERIDDGTGDVVRSVEMLEPWCADDTTIRG